MRKGILFFFISLQMLTAFYCVPQKERRTSSESGITILCRGMSEQNVFLVGPVMQLMFVPLVRFDPEGKHQPCLLEAWEHDENFKKWTFHLRRDVLWHDGLPVTAHDVKFTMEVMTHPDVGYELRIFSDIEVIDDFTCVVRSDQPFNPLNYAFCEAFPKHLLESLDVKGFYSWDFWKQPVGSGPYRYLHHVPQEMVELEVNPYYYGEKPRIGRVVLKFGDNPLPELLSGNVDMVTGMTPLELLQIQRNPNFRTIHKFSFNRKLAIIWNQKRPIFESAQIRKALTLAINRKELLQLLNLPDDIPIFDVGFTQGQYYRNEIPPPLPYDPELAETILDEEGWTRREGNGVREKDGREFIFSLLVSPDFQTGAVFLQDQFRKVGIRANIQTMESWVLIEKRPADDFDALVHNIFVFDYKSPGGGSYDNPDFVDLLEAAYKTNTVEDFDKAVEALWPFYIDDMPFTFLFPETKYLVVNTRVQGLEEIGHRNPVTSLDKLWIKE